MQTITCHTCQHQWDFEPPMGRGEECPNCRGDSRVCLNCRHYDKNAYHECREPQAEYVADKNRGNFCGYFSPSSRTGSTAQNGKQAQQDLAALFGDQPSDESDAPKSHLEKELEGFFKK